LHEHVSFGVWLQCNALQEAHTALYEMELDAQEAQRISQQTRELLDSDTEDEEVGVNVHCTVHPQAAFAPSLRMVTAAGAVLYMNIHFKHHLEPHDDCHSKCLTNRSQWRNPAVM